MLQELSIKNFAIITTLDISFEKGMTVLTGETGAGKSIIIDAVSLLVGGRGSTHFIRNGTDKSILQGYFKVLQISRTTQILDDLGIEYDNGTIILQRELYRNGRNVCRVNGMLVNTSTLKLIGETIVDIYGQNDYQELMQPDKHVLFLDDFGGNSVKLLLRQYHRSYLEYQKLYKAKIDHSTHQKEWDQRLDMLRFQVEEIENANLKPGEEDQLITQRDRLINFQKINENLQKSYSNIEGENEIFGAIDLSGKAMNALAEITDFDDNFQSIYELIKTAFYALQDASIDITKQIDFLEFNETKLEQIEQRIEEIKQLKQKYGNSESSILNFFNTIKIEKANMESKNLNKRDLDDKLIVQESELEEIGLAIRKKRQMVARYLKVAIQQELADLYMSKTIFEIRFSYVDSGHFLVNGLDYVEFYIQPNPGEEIKPLSKIASGGELSRLMLALKKIFSKSQGVPSIIFDEADTGVSGRVAQSIAKKISGIAKNLQILCITHLPQVAAISDHHYYINKKVTDKRTETHITKLNKNARIKELARMLTGPKTTELTLDHAKELLEMENEVKKE